MVCTELLSDCSSVVSEDNVLCGKLQQIKLFLLRGYYILETGGECNRNQMEETSREWGEGLCALQAASVCLFVTLICIRNQMKTRRPLRGLRRSSVPAA